MKSLKQQIPTSIKYGMKHIIWNLHRHNPSEKSNICIFTTRRSGGTWLTETISVEKGMLYVIQPFSKGIDDLFLRRRDVFAPSVIENGRVPVRGCDDDWMFQFFTQIFAGKLKVENPWNIFQPSFDFFTERVCVKLHDTKAWIEWFDESFDNMSIIYLFRHPLPQSLSTIKRGWIITIPYYLKDEWFVENYMSNDLMLFTDHILKKGTILEKYVTNWCIENLVPIKRFRYHPDWIVLSYEELVVNTMRAVDFLVSKLRLNNKDEIVKKAILPSETVFNENTVHLLTGKLPGNKVAYLLRRWKKSVSVKEEKEAFRILERFGIDLYKYKDIGPSHEVLNFSDTSAKLDSFRG